jgi:hypothetical protein
MAKEGTSDNTTGVFAADEANHFTSTGVLDIGDQPLSKEDTTYIDPFKNEQYQSARGELAAHNINSFEKEYNHGQTTWGDWLERLNRGAGEIVFPVKRAILGGIGELSDRYYKAKGDIPDREPTSVAMDAYYGGVNNFLTEKAKVVTNPSYAANNLSVADNTQRWFDSEKIKENLDREEAELQAPLHQGLREGKWGDKVGVTAGNLMGGVVAFEALGGSALLGSLSVFPNVGRLVGGGIGVGKVVETLVGNKVAKETIKEVISSRAFEAEEAALGDLGKPFVKLFKNTAAQRSAAMGLQKGIEVVSDMVQFISKGAAEGLVFTAGEKIVHNLGDIALHEPMASYEEVTSDLMSAAVVGGLFGGVVGGYNLGGLSVGKNVIKWTYKKGKSLVLWRRDDMAAAGENVGNAFISTGELNTQSVIKSGLNKVRSLLRKNPEQQKDINSAIQDIRSKLNESLAERETLYVTLKKYTANEWKQVPAALYARFARHIEDLKHIEDGGADKYARWSAFLKKEGPKLPANGPHAKLTKYHKDKQIALDDSAREFHDSIHKPLETHAAERDTIKKIEESKRYEQLSAKNKKLLKERFEQLGEHGEEHPLTRDLRKIDKINSDIEAYNNHQRVGKSVTSPPSMTTEDEINNDKFMKASENIQPEEVGKSAKEEFDDSVPSEDELTQKAMEETFDETEYVNLPKEDKTLATKTFDRIQKIEHDHGSISKLYDDVAKCIVGGGRG